MTLPRAAFARRRVIAPLLVDWSGTAADYARLLDESASGEQLGTGAAAIVRRHTSAWAAGADLAAGFDGAGGKDGMAPGILTVAAHGIPRQGEYAGNRRAVAVFANGLGADVFVPVIPGTSLPFAAELAGNRTLAEHVRLALPGAGSGRGR